MENLVVFFRNQDLTHEQHKAFGRASANLRCTRPRRAPESAHPEILVIKADENSKHIAGEEWHSDVRATRAADRQHPLYEGGAARNGGDTLFASMYPAYETLSAPIQRLCEA